MGYMMFCWDQTHTLTVLLVLLLVPI